MLILSNCFGCPDTKKRFANDLNAICQKNCHLANSNIFDSITDDKAEVSELQTRSDLMIVIRDLISSHGWTQVQAGQKLGLTQPRVSDLVNGRIEKFSIDKLMCCLYQVGFRFKPVYQNNTLTMTIEQVST